MRNPQLVCPRPDPIAQGAPFFHPFARGHLYHQLAVSGGNGLHAGLHRQELDLHRIEEILRRQKDAIEEQLQLKAPQLSFDFTGLTKTEQRQVEADRKHMEYRLQAIEQEIQTEPEDLKSLYQVSLRRLQPVGLVVLWPKARG